MFYAADDAEPPHVHVIWDEDVCKWWLDSCQLAFNRGFAPHELTRIRRILQANRALIRESWDAFFDQR